MPKVYVVQHAYGLESGSEEIKFIGVYSTEHLAQEAALRLKVLPGFRDHIDGFHVSSYELDKDHWTEGFIGWEEANT